MLGTARPYWVVFIFLYTLFELICVTRCSSHLFGGNVPAACVRWLRCARALWGPVAGGWLLSKMCRGRPCLPCRIRLKGETTVRCRFSLPFLFPLSLPLPVPLPLSVPLLSSTSSFIASHRNVSHCCLHFLGGPDGKLREFGGAWCTACIVREININNKRKTYRW